MASSQHRCVFVGNIPYDATEEQLIQICEEVGPVVSFRLVLDRETGKPKGYGFCEYKDEETALSARRNLQGYEINGRQLRVDFAENDKGADRNKEQGRGGPGLIGNFDPQKPLASAAFNQPIGLALAANAASILAVVSNNTQASNVSSARNGFPNQLGIGSDPITLYLAKMSRNQLHEILSEMQALAKQNQPLAQQVLLSYPQLTKAIFQALIMLGLVPSQMLSNIRQTPVTSSTISLHEEQFLSSQQIQQPRLQTSLQVGLIERLPGVPSVAQNSSLLQSLVQNMQGQPGLHSVSQTQNQTPVQLVQLGGTSGLTVQAHPLTSLPVLRSQTPATSSKPLHQQMQPPFPQHSRPDGYTVLGNVQSAVQSQAVVQPFPAQAISNQSTLKSAPPSTPMQATGFRDTGGSVPIIDSMHSNFNSGLVDPKTFSPDTSDMLRPSKLAKLDGGTGPSGVMGTGIISGVSPSSTSVSGTTSVAANQISNADVTPKTEQQVPQVMNLTPEQLSSLPPEQRQQVLQLQQMLR